MAQFTYSEDRSLQYHRAILSQARKNEDILTRAVQQLERMRLKKPNLIGVWTRWDSILKGSIDDIAEVVLADTPDAGLLRQHSPLGDAMTPRERNALWRSIGLIQFALTYLTAANDLGLSYDEQARIIGVDAEALKTWHLTPPVELSGEQLAAIKQVIAMQSALRGLFGDMDERQAWLREHHEGLEGTPLEIVLAGDAPRVQHYLADTVRPTLKAKDLPQA